MKENKILIILLLSSIILASCIGSAVYSKKLAEGYELSANDDITGMKIYVQTGEYQVGIIDACVYSVGYNDDFIIVKQHPMKELLINKSITNYYIIPIKNKIQSDITENKIGPLSYRYFLIKRDELKIPNELDFSITIDELK